jgi:hypothetical protein
VRFLATCAGRVPSISSTRPCRSSFTEYGMLLYQLIRTNSETRLKRASNYVVSTTTQSTRGFNSPWIPGAYQIKLSENLP